MSIIKRRTKKLIEGLEQISNLHKNNEFEILKSQEDSHTAIEAYLTQKYWEVGKKYILEGLEMIKF